MASNRVETKHVLTSTFSLQTTHFEQCMLLSVGDVPTMNREFVVLSLGISSYKSFYTTVVYVPQYRTVA